jgi:hypothetical protein
MVNLLEHALQYRLMSSNKEEGYEYTFSVLETINIFIPQQG